MKRRFISSALAMLMLLTTLLTAACGEKENSGNTLEIEGDDSSALTLSIWGVKGEGTTDEAIAAVEAAMSKITQTQFNTAIELNLFFEDEYEQKLEERMDAIQADIDAEKEAEQERKKAENEAKKRGETLAPVETEAPEDTKAEEETVLDEYGLPMTKYPEVGERQLDIFLITDYEMLTKYNDKEVLSALDAELSGASKLIKQYVHPTLVSAGVVNGKTVAILNQQPVGEYTYMLVNRELADKYYWDVESFKELADTYDFVLDVKREEPEYQPIVGDLSYINANYFSLDGEKTIVGNMVGADKVYGDSFEPMIIFQSTNWSRYTKLYMKLYVNDCIGSETFTPEDKFGVGVLKGTGTDIAAYAEDYHIVPLQVPQGTTDNLFNGMFAVSTYTKDLARSMEVITYLNTRSDLRNLFGYGVEGVHYELDEEGNLKKLNNDYNMKLEYTGNCFIAHIPEGEAADYWDIAKEHNIELVLSPYFQFEIDPEEIDMDMYNHILEVSRPFYEGLYLCTTEEEALDYIDDYWELAEEDEIIELWINQTPEAPSEEEEPPKTLGAYYITWKATH